MKDLDYSSFSRFCFCAYKGYADVLSPDFHLGRHCRKMSYDEMLAFYERFKDTVKYVGDPDQFLYHLKWIDTGPDTDWIREIVLLDIFQDSYILKKDCVDELYDRYDSDIQNLIFDLMEQRSPDISSYPDCDDECLPF